MGIAIVPFFGDMPKAELEKELEKVNAGIAKLNDDKAAIEKALKAYDGSAEG